MGRMFSGSKAAYMGQHPNNRVFFNACLFDKDNQQIWFGDVDLTLDKENLQNLANEIGTIYVTSEYPFRWDGLEKGKILYAENVVRFDPVEVKND